MSWSPEGSAAASDDLTVTVADAAHERYLEAIAAAIDAEVDRGSIGLARRSVAWLTRAVQSGDALIALAARLESDWAGFCVSRLWDDGFVSTSALIVKPGFRRRGIARRLKEAALERARQKHPHATPFGLTVSEPIAAINLELGFEEVPYADITTDAAFWAGCEGCPMHATLLENDGRSCHCRAFRLGSSAGGGT